MQMKAMQSIEDYLKPFTSLSEDSCSHLGLGAFAQCFQDRLKFHHDPDQDQAVTESMTVSEGGLLIG